MKIQVNLRTPANLRQYSAFHTHVDDVRNRHDLSLGFQHHHSFLLSRCEHQVQQTVLQDFPKG